MSNLRNVFNGFAAGAALVAALVTGAPAAAQSTASPADQDSTMVTATPTQAALARGSATVVDLSADRADLSPAVNHIVTSVQEALAAKQKVIIMLGEEHGTINHVRMAELLRIGLHRAGIANPVMAEEMSAPFLMEELLSIFPEDSQGAFHTRVMQALKFLEKDDPARHHRLQATMMVAWDSTVTPITRLENMSIWLDEGVDIRLVDIMKTTARHINSADPATGAFIDAHSVPDITDKTQINTTSVEGMRLRNLWMAAQLRTILSEDKSRVVILQTGGSHIGGRQPTGYPYRHALHGLLANAAHDNVKVLTVFQECYGVTFKGFLPVKTQKAMNNPNTIIVRGSYEDQHWQGISGSFAREARALEIFAKRSGMPEAAPHIKNRDDYDARLNKNRGILIKEIEAVTAQYAPAAQKIASGAVVAAPSP